MMNLDNSLAIELRDFIPRGSRTQLITSFREALSHPKVADTSRSEARYSVYSSFLIILLQVRHFPNYVLQAVIDAGVIESVLSLMSSNTDLPTHETCRNILISFGACCSQIKLDSNLFSAFTSFCPRGPRRKTDMNIVYDCIRQLIGCTDQSIIIPSGIISMLLSQEISEELLSCVLNFTIETLSVSTRTEGFLDHLIDSGLISFFVSALKSRHRLESSTADAVISCLQKIRKLNSRYLKIIQDHKLPRLLEPVIMGDVDEGGLI